MKNKLKLSKILTVTKNIFHYLMISVLVLLIFITSYLCIDKFIVGNEIPSFFSYSLLSVESGSMENTIHEGDFIIIKDTNDYKIGDIITYQQEGDSLPTTHRIVLIENDQYITKGDANNIKDFDPVNESEILGEVVFRIPYLGLFFRWAKTLEGIIFISCFIVSLVALYLIYKHSKKEENEEISS